MMRRKKIQKEKNNTTHIFTYNLKTVTMNKSSISMAALLVILVTTLTSCEAIGSIFKAGIWTGVIGIALVVFLILYLNGRSKK